jgi:nitroreductase
MKESANLNNVALENILNRKSVRRYTEESIPEEMLVALVRAAMAAPSAKNLRPVEFIISTERDFLDKMGEALPYAKMLKHSQQAIIICGRKDINPNLWMLDASASTENLLLAAESLEFGAVWTALYPYEQRMEVVSRLYDLPENVAPFAVVPVGFPLTDSLPKDKFDESKIHMNKW